jgi:hypothetical protein
VTFDSRPQGTPAPRPGFDLDAKGPFGILAAIVIFAMVMWWLR